MHQAVVLQTQGVFVLPAAVAVALAAGLGAAPPVAGAAADHGGEVALAGIAHAQGTVAEYLDFNGRIGADIANLVPVQLPAQNHPLHAQGGTQLHAGQGMDSHLSGAVDGNLRGNLAAELGHAQILDDVGVDAGLGGFADQIGNRLEFPVGDQGVQGQMHVHTPDVAVF